MSVARLVPETWELSGDDARETLVRTGRRQLVRDAFVRFRASDGFSHARSLAFVISLLLVQGVIVLVGLAAALGDTDVSASIVRSINEAVPGPAGRALTRAVFHAYRTGTSGQYFVLVVVGLAALWYFGGLDRLLPVSVRSSTVFPPTVTKATPEAPKPVAPAPKPGPPTKT